MFRSALFYAGFLHCSLASICLTGDNTEDVITQNPSEVEAQDGDTVSFTCTIDDKHNVSVIFVRKDEVNVMIKDRSGFIQRDENIFFSGSNHSFTISVLVRNKSDSNTYYCDARLHGQSPEICGAGTFIKIPVVATGSLFKALGIPLLVVLGLFCAGLVVYYIAKPQKG